MEEIQEISQNDLKQLLNCLPIKQKFLHDVPINYLPINCSCGRDVNLKIQKYRQNLVVINSIQHICCKKEILSAYNQVQSPVNIRYKMIVCYICGIPISNSSKNTCCKEFL